METRFVDWRLFDTCTYFVQFLDLPGENVPYRMRSNLFFSFFLFCFSFVSKYIFLITFFFEFEIPFDVTFFFLLFFKFFSTIFSFFIYFCKLQDHMNVSVFHSSHCKGSFFFFTFGFHSHFLVWKEWKVTAYVFF